VAVELFELYFDTKRINKPTKVGLLLRTGNNIKAL